MKCCFSLKLYLSTPLIVGPKLLEHLYFHQLKNCFTSVIYIFCCSVSVGNISLHVQILILQLIVIIQWGFCLHLDLVCLSLFCFFMSFQTDWMMIRSDLCVEHWLLSGSLCKHKPHWKTNAWTCKLIFPTDTLQQKTDITDHFLAGENTSVLIILVNRCTFLC